MRENIQSRSTNPFYIAVLSTLILLGIDLGVSILLADPQKKLIYSDIVTPIIDLLATVALIITAKRCAAHSKRLGIAWGIIGLSLFVFTLGDVCWAILELGLQEPPFPSIADAFYITYYPFLLFGVFLLPEKPTTRGEQIRKVIDIGIVMVSAVLAFWNFLLGPMIEANADYSLLEQVVLLAYPVGDLVLLWALLQIIYRPSDQRDLSETPALLLAAGIAVTILGDWIFTYQSLTGTYVSGGVLDITWRATMLLTGLAGISQVTAIQSSTDSWKLPFKLDAFAGSVKIVAHFLSYACLIAAYVLLIKSHLTPLPMDFLSVSFAVGGMIGLVLLRQVITLNENNNLNIQLQAQTSQLENANWELQKEIAERKVVEQRLIHDSFHDSMTGLPNRVLFLDRLGQAIEYSKRGTENIFAVLFVDIDQFKVINDSLGHLTGDQLLISVGKRMKENLRASDTVARFGGDEFAILLQVTGEQESVLTIAQKIQEAIKLPIKLERHELYITASIGIVMNAGEYDHPQEVLRDADIAMYQAKVLGKARSEIFDIKMRSLAFSRLAMEEEIRTALDRNEFRLYYQPILSVESNQLVSFETLIRWQHAQRGLILPSEFLSIAEESGLILPLGKWILNEACSQLKKWHQKYPGLQDVSINVNVSNRQFSQPDFIDEVVEALQVNGLRASSLKLEITESVLIRNYEAANMIFTQLQNLGIQLHIDDFGSGYSALGYLQHFPISAVKIDKSFIDEIGKGRRGIEIIRAIVSMTRELGMEAIAEGIETTEQLNQIKSLSCNLGQGFLLSKPLDTPSAESILKQAQEARNANVEF